MMPPPVKTKADARAQAQTVIRLRLAFTPGRRPDWKEARAAILAGAPVDTPIPAWSGATQLIIAATSDCFAEINWSLDHGANTEAVCSDGNTTLVHAVVHGHVAATTLLLDHGANPNARDRNGTPVLVMALDHNGHWTMNNALTDLLLDHGADPNARDWDSWTALMVVTFLNATQSTERFVATLIKHGADLAATAPGGRTIPELFMANGRPELTGYLDEALIGDHRAAARRRLLNRLTAAQCAAWLPKACAAEAAMAVSTAWHRTP